MAGIDRFKSQKPATSWRARLHEIIFEADTPAGKTFDILLIFAILLSVAAVSLESVSVYRQRFGTALYAVEWFFTILFTVEYVLRWMCVMKPYRYATSFFGVVDLLAVLPTYLDLLLPGSRFLFVIRVLRLLRIFRVLKLVQYVGEADVLMRALRASRRKILIFLFGVLTIVVIMGSVMYVIEGAAHGFTSIPRSIYWAIVTLTTVGYGDISPRTGLGQAMAAMLMIIGYSIIAVPTGIMSAEITHASSISTQACPQCGAEGHETGARFCRRCGASMDWHHAG
jgi:voltage-gated potassium channel